MAIIHYEIILIAHVDWYAHGDWLPGETACKQHLLYMSCLHLVTGLQCALEKPFSIVMSFVHTGKAF